MTLIQQLEEESEDGREGLNSNGPIRLQTRIVRLRRNLPFVLLFIFLYLIFFNKTVIDHKSN